MKTLVLCVGNEIVGDDAVGPRVGRVLRRLSLPAHVTVELRAAVGLEFLDDLAAWDRVVLVDAMRTGRAAGACAVLELEEIARLAQVPAFGHAFGVAEIVALARRIRGGAGVARVSIVGIEALQLQRFDTGLSAAVRAALPGAVDVVLGLVGAPREVRDSARSHAIELARWSPTPSEL